MFCSIVNKLKLTAGRAASDTPSTRHSPLQQVKTLPTPPPPQGGEGKPALELGCIHLMLFLGAAGGGGVHVHMFAHNKSGIAYRSRDRRSETVANHKMNPSSS
jgi:hypothetical protein